MSRIFTLGLMLALAFSMNTNVANAQLTDNFDSYADGTLLDGINGWKGWDASATVAGRAQDAFSSSAPNSIEILNNNDGATGLSTDAINEMGQPSSGQWTFSCEVYVPSTAPSGGPAGGLQWFIMQNTYIDNGAKNWSVQSQFDNTTGLIVDDFEDVAVDPASWPGAPILYDTWMKIQVDMDFDADAVQIRMDINGDGTFVDFGADGVQFTADDELVNWLNYPWSTRGFNNTNTGGLVAMGALDLYGGDDAGGNVNGAAYYDNISFAPTPAGGFCPPTSFSTFRGLVISAQLSDFVDSDDVRARYNPGFVLNSAEAPVWLVFDGNCPTAIDFRVESQAGTPGLTYTVEAYNWNTSMYEVIGTHAESFNSDTFSKDAIVPADHIDGDGDVRSRVGWRKTGLTINFPWEVQIDQVGWNQ